MIKPAASRRTASLCDWKAMALIVAVFAISAAGGEEQAAAGALDFIELAPDGRGFRHAATGEAFTPWGFNYDHDDGGQLIEDYWINEWDAVAGDFREMKALGANVVRVHLQFGRFLPRPDEPDAANLRQLARLVTLAEEVGLYLDVTGLGCYHKADVPVWYDALDEAERWAAQARFWEIVARTCARSPAIFCYDLMNEPVVPVGRRAAGDWLGAPFAGKHFVQFLTCDQDGRDRADIGRRWIETLVGTIRKEDRRHLVTVGLVDWSLERPGLQSGMVPGKIAAALDFICVHLYPRESKLAEDLETLAGFAAVGKPVVIEETFPLQCSPESLAKFIDASRAQAKGWIGFYWGKPLEELQPRESIPDALLAEWLKFFRAEAARLSKAERSVVK